MLNAIVRFSLRFRGIVMALAMAFLGYGVYSLTQAKFSVFPEFAPPFVTIQTESPGLSPEQVELLVTQPIENAVNGVSGIQSRLISVLVSALSLSGYHQRGAHSSLEEKIRRMVGDLHLTQSNVQEWLGPLRQVLWKLENT